jgi:hypothetical protein
VFKARALTFAGVALTGVTCLALSGCFEERIVTGAVNRPQFNARPGLTLLNPGAKTPIWLCPTVEAWTGIGAKTEWVGMYRTNEDAIYIRGAFAANVLVHEYQHHLEERLKNDPSALRIARKAFRDLCSPDFEIGNADLLSDDPYAKPKE